MFSFESKLHYEKVLGPAKRFVPKSEKDDSEWESTLDSRLNQSKRILHSETSPIQDPLNSHHASQQYFQSYKLPMTNHPHTNWHPVEMKEVGISPMSAKSKAPHTDRNMAVLMNNTGIQVTIDGNIASSTKFKRFESLAQSIKKDELMKSAELETLEVKQLLAESQHNAVDQSDNKYGSTLSQIMPPRNNRCSNGLQDSQSFEHFSSDFKKSQPPTLVSSAVSHQRKKAKAQAIQLKEHELNLSQAHQSIQYAMQEQATLNLTQENKYLQLQVSEHLQQFNAVLQDQEKTLQEQMQLNRTLQEEKDMNLRLLQKLQERDTETELLQRICEQQDIQNTLHQREITRISRKAAELQKKVVKEKTLREAIVTEMTYSNPAKLMNYLKAQKAKKNSSFRSMAEYVSHVDAYARTVATEAKKEQGDKRQKYAQLLAHKRLNDPSLKHQGSAKPPKPEIDTGSNTLLSSLKPPEKVSKQQVYYPCRSHSSLNSRFEMFSRQNISNQVDSIDNETVFTAANYLNTDLNYGGKGKPQVYRQQTSLSGVGIARNKLSSALNETNRMMKYENEFGKDKVPTQQKTMRDLLSEQRMALRNFSSYCNIRGNQN